MLYKRFGFAGLGSSFPIMQICLPSQHVWSTWILAKYTRIINIFISSDSGVDSHNWDEI